MRRKIIILLILSILMNFALTGCSSSKTTTSVDITLMDPIGQSNNSINFTVDPRIELLSIVQILSKYPERFPTEIVKMDFEYKNKIMEHFGEFKNHKAVKTFEKMMPGLNYDAPPGLMLFMDKDFTTRDDTELTEYIIKRAGGEKNIDKLFNDLKEFAIDTNFNDFYNDNNDYYNAIVDGSLDLVSGEEDTVEDLEEYYGMKQKSYNIVFVSLYGGGAYGPLIETTGGKEIYSIMGPSMIDFSGIPYFTTKSNFIYLTHHEFSHSFINPITEANYGLVKSYEKLFEPVKEIMSTNFAYGSWDTCLNEHIIRALTARFVYHKDKDNGGRILINEKNIGFIYVEALFNKLEVYEDNRDKYPTIEDFYPELLKSLEGFQ